jgi:hypothetical protein
MDKQLPFSWLFVEELDQLSNKSKDWLRDWRIKPDCKTRRNWLSTWLYPDNTCHLKQGTPD